MGFACCQGAFGIWKFPLKVHHIPQPKIVTLPELQKGANSGQNSNDSGNFHSATFLTGKGGMDGWSSQEEMLMLQGQLLSPSIAQTCAHPVVEKATAHTKGVHPCGHFWIGRN